ncbi:protein TPX2 isoform X2 [Sesamum indicum]|uniref:Protein TPX2 isoform X2 n=1 Tax=Sesamum indicum TaxID=4182 RepID=A0A6I9T767_SESIN|nr:protein TPX2 isoform X2 [Sesamum indicum]
MEEEIEDFVDDFYVEPSESDEDYEFEACQFYDFTRQESESEIDEAERWFDVSGNYPPSPFIVKLNLEKLLSAEAVPHSSKSKYGNNTKSASSSSDNDIRHGASTSKKDAKGKNMLHDNAKAKAKSADKLFQSKSSTFMNPTASHLAKQTKAHDEHSSHICTRFQKTSVKLEKVLPSPIGHDNLATKRQKLEIGYLRKVAQMKHQFSLLHKSSKKVTVPKEPELETLLRAQRRGSKNSSASETESGSSKAKPLNKKTLESPPLPKPKKSIPHPREFQEFHLKTMERANHHASAKERRSSSSDKLESPPTEQLTELSLGSASKANSPPQLGKHASAKGIKKDAHGSFQAEFWRCPGKPKQCGGHMRAHEAERWSNMTRSLGIR